MSEEVCGAGIALDKDFDFIIDSSGDLDSVSGLEELEKDLSFQTKRNLDVKVGAPLDQTQVEVIKVKATRIIQLDPRVSSVDTITIEEAEADNTLRINTQITANDGQTYDFVFPVGDE